MKYSEKIKTIAGKKDNLARRVLNTAPTKNANLTARDIEKGISIEALEKLNVPVYRYDTQITIHGKIPDLKKSNLYVQNQNGSLGVRYVAIDNDKKKTLYNASLIRKTLWRGRMDSSGFVIYMDFEPNEREKCLATLKTVPTELFYGSATAYSLLWDSGYTIQCSIGAIPQENLETILLWFFDMNQTQLFEEQEKMKIEQEKKHKERMKEIAEYHAENEKEK